VTLALRGIRLADIEPIVDGAPSPEARIETRVLDGRTELTVVLPRGGRLASIGVRLQAHGVRQYLRNGYMSWDGSFFVEPATAREVAKADARLTAGYAMTALLPAEGEGAVVLGFLRHDRFQSRVSFALGEPLGIDLETLIDGVPHEGEVRSETLTIFAGDAVEPALRQWAELVAAASPRRARLPKRRLTGWCSWYNLYASLSEPVLLEHLAALQRFRDAAQTPFDIFLVDDGFTPEMGDWLETKPQFPNGMRPVLDAARDAGFIPGLWIAPFMVGNRSTLYAEHPGWVVKDRATGAPLVPMKFYGEFRWHKRSEEYYVLDVTHPDAEDYIRTVFRTWARDWGVGYFKTDFMHLGATYGPEEARWHEEGLSRVAIWMRMANLIREEIGEALWLCCGAPLLPPVGLCDAMRIGRDIGVTWTGNYSAESLLRDQTSRNFMHGVFWQADPDCILLRDRFHELSDDQVNALAAFAGLAGGVLMTSDQLDEVPETRRQMLHALAGDGAPFACEFPELGQSGLTYRLGTGPNGRPMAVSEARDPVLVQRVRRPDGSVLLNLFNTGDTAAEKSIDARLAGLAFATAREGDAAFVGPVVGVTLRPHQSRQFLLSAARSGTPPPSRPSR
jgi:alpha-galactosidase